MFIDSHAHLNFRAFQDDADEVIRRSLDNGVWMINVGSQLETSKRAVKLAQKYSEGVYASIGFHPIHILERKKEDADEALIAEDENSFSVSGYEKLARSSNKVVAIGEIGLDYYYKPKTKIRLEEFKSIQKRIFLGQISLAFKLDLPVIFHCRMAHPDLIGVLSKTQNPRMKGVIHCFTGTWEEAQKYLELGLYLGFNGIIYKMNLDEVIKKVPLDKILIETDCPYLTPPFLGEARNEPLNVKYISQKIAEIKNTSLPEISEKTTENARKLFGIS